MHLVRRKVLESVLISKSEKLYTILFLATLNAAVNGYDGSVMSSINSYAQYRSYFGFSLTEGTPATGIVYAIFTIGSMFISCALRIGYFESLTLKCDLSDKCWRGWTGYLIGRKA